MVNDMNKVQLMGRLTRNPESKYVGGSGDTLMVKYTLAVNRRYRGSNSTASDFINCVVYGKGVYTDQIEHTARRFSAWLPPIQCTLSGHQCMMIILQG